MGHLEQSAEVWRGLLDQNPESHEYYKEYLLTQGVDLGISLSGFAVRRRLTLSQRCRQC